jgi:hypothetical protein
MSSRLDRNIFSAQATRLLSRLLLLSSLLGAISLAACSKKNEPDPVTDDHFVEANEKVVYQTDSTEWHVCLFATGKLYADAVQVSMPAPWRLPTREEAQILKTIEYPSEERFVTSDGYTFGTPSASVTKAGAKTKYSVLGLWIRTTVIQIDF